MSMGCCVFGISERVWSARGDVAGRTTLGAADRGRAGRHTLGGLGQRCGERIANCD